MKRRPVRPRDVDLCDPRDVFIHLASSALPIVESWGVMFVDATSPPSKERTFPLCSDSKCILQEDTK